MPLKAGRLLLAALAVPVLSRAAAERDASVLVQGSVRAHHVQTLKAGDSVKDTESGPIAHTELGSIQGASEDGYNIFRGVPYKEPPERFAVGEPKRAWAPEILNATQFKPGCIGAGTGVPEDEDCLYMNIWLPKGGRKNMPVILYFHGGLQLHGSGQENYRQGDLIVQDEEFPTIWINLDFRLGIFGWIYPLEGSNISHNLGLQDQQEALRWIQKHIAAFGGDPTRVTLQGQSGGCQIVVTHMVAPASRNLFHRASLHSPPADMWSRASNFDRTQFMIARGGCKRPSASSTLRCLRMSNARKLWSNDWVTEELSRNVLSPTWIKNAYGTIKYAIRNGFGRVTGDMGWYPVVDNDTLPGEPRELIRQGRWNKAEVLITVSPNESYGVIPSSLAFAAMPLAFRRLLKRGDTGRVTELYKQTLGATDKRALKHMMLTDKMFTCDARTTVRDMELGGGKAYLGMFWHAPKWDPIGRSSNKVCSRGATCHASEMLYVLPQAPERNGIPHTGKFEPEWEFAQKYMRSFLAFVSGSAKHPWVRYNLTTEPLTFYDTNGTHVEYGYRREQCKVLDSSMGEQLPNFMKTEVGL